MDAALYYSVPQIRPFISPLCFRIGTSMPMRLVRFIGNRVLSDGTDGSVWEVVDMMRDTEFVMLLPRSTYIEDQPSI